MTKLFLFFLFIVNFGMAQYKTLVIKKHKDPIIYFDSLDKISIKNNIKESQSITQDYQGKNYFPNCKTLSILDCETCKILSFRATYIFYNSDVNLASYDCNQNIIHDSIISNFTKFPGYIFVDSLHYLDQKNNKRKLGYNLIIKRPKYDFECTKCYGDGAYFYIQKQTKEYKKNKRHLYEVNKNKQYNFYLNYGWFWDFNWNLSLFTYDDSYYIVDRNSLSKRHIKLLRKMKHKKLIKKMNLNNVNIEIFNLVEAYELVNENTNNFYSDKQMKKLVYSDSTRTIDTVRNNRAINQQMLKINNDSIIIKDYEIVKINNKELILGRYYCTKRINKQKWALNFSVDTDFKKYIELQKGIVSKTNQPLQIEYNLSEKFEIEFTADGITLTGKFNSKKNRLKLKSGKDRYTFITK